MNGFPGESVACPWCGVEAGRKCLTVDGRHQFASHSRRIHLEATRDNACDECGAPAGSNCVAQNRFSRARAHAVRVQAHLHRWEQDTPPAPELDADEKAQLDYADYLNSLERMFPDVPPAEVDAPLGAPPAEVDAPLGAPPAEVDAPLGAPPAEVVLSDRDQQTLDFIRAACLDQGGPPLLDQSQFPLPRRTTQRSLKSLRMAGEVTWGETQQGRRGVRRYYLRGQHPTEALGIANVTSAPTGGAPCGASNGSGSKEGGSLKEPVFEDENIRSSLPGSGTRDDFDAPLDAPPAELNVCPLHRDPTCVAPTRYWNLKTAGDARGDLIVYCWGDNFKCSWVHSRLYGEIVEAGLHRLSDQDLTSRYYDVAAAAFAAAATSASDPRKRDLEDFVARYSGLPQEVYSVMDRPSPAPPLEPRPEPPPWDETNPDYCADRPDPVSTWQAALGRLQLEIPQEQFNTFLRPCSGLRWEDDCLVVGAATTFAVSWLELPLHLEMVREAVAKTTGAQLSVRYKADRQS